jgi:hypothetical protein
VLWRRHLSTVVLGVLAVVLAIYVFVIDRGRPTSAETEARTRNVFPVLRRADLDAIAVRQGSSSFRLVRREKDAGSASYDLEPEGGPPEAADMTAVSKLIADLELGARERRAPLDARETGLDAPETEISLSMGRLTYRLRIGKAAPAPAGAAYAALEGEGPIVVRRDLLSAIQRPWESYRTRMLVPYGTSGAERIVISSDGASYRLRRSPGGDLRLETEHGLVRVERAAMQRLASALADLRAESFVGAEPAGGGDRLVIEMAPHDPANPPVRITIGGPCPGASDQRIAVRHAPAPRLGACVAEAALSVFTAPAWANEDLRLFSVRADEFEEILLERGPERLELARMGTGWHMRSPHDDGVDGDTGNALALDLAELAGLESVAPPAAFAARGKAVVTEVGGARTQSIEIGELGAEGTALARRTDDGAFLRLSADAVRALAPVPERLRSRTVLDVPLASVHRVAVEIGDVRQSLRRGGGGVWSMLEPKGFAIDNGIANDLAEAIGHLRAARWVQTSNAGGFSARGKVVLEHDAGDGAPAIETLLIGAPATGGALAKLERSADVFLLANADERTFATWALDRSALALDPKGARAIRVRRGTETWTAHAPFQPNDERQRAVENVLDELRAEAAVHTGPARPEEGFVRPLLEIWVDERHVAIGAGDAWRGVNVYYARKDGVDATFVVARGKVKRLVEGW